MRQTAALSVNGFKVSVESSLAGSFQIHIFLVDRSFTVKTRETFGPFQPAARTVLADMGPYFSQMQ